jgi:hypothetical protein
MSGLLKLKHFYILVFLLAYVISYHLGTGNLSEPLGK